MPALPRDVLAELAAGGAEQPLEVSWNLGVWHINHRRALDRHRGTLVEVPAGVGLHRDVPSLAAHDASPVAAWHGRPNPSAVPRRSR